MKIKSIFKLSKWIGLFLTTKHAKGLSDRLFIYLEYYACMGKCLSLKNPITFNEKLQWLKLNDRNPLYTKMVDKVAAKEYVANIIGERYIIPTLGVWDKPEDIDFDKLPDQFVLKVTHDSGGLVICKDKTLFDRNKAIEKLKNSLKRDYYSVHREWPYKDVQKRVLAEAYMEDASTQELRDYKFFTFNGKVKLMFVASDRQTVGEETKFDFFDREYNFIDLRNGHPNSVNLPAKPKNYGLMIEFAEKLSQGIPHVRVDFYEVNGKVYFGEITFSHWSGLVPFDPPEWDKKMGEWLVLP